MGSTYKEAVKPSDLNNIPIELNFTFVSSRATTSGDSYLVASTDGVGTKLKLVFETGIHETIGIDLVAMSGNDIVTSGAKPLCSMMVSS
ncbi:hypothetical protein Vadar_020456 [Vaccinium darrowii]|uniref:Uncharacterized protein n=1 Tax=Vaccinium darrowii TaxID=229202 RepID=A0ACB7XIQ7_9ERIC|nr:hypothetical protein Vadar_020456 [Vaccinium darrowii]